MADAGQLRPDPSDPAFLRRAATAVTVALRARPGARRALLEWSESAGLRASVTAPAEDGRANRAVIDLLAGEWRLPRSALAVVRGLASRDKVVRISGDPAALAGRIREWVGGRKGSDG